MIRLSRSRTIRRLVKPKDDAQRYFNIRPAGGEAEGKVLTISAA